MRKRRIAASILDEEIAKVASETDHAALAIWAADCAERVLPLFEMMRPGDDRPRWAIEAARAWARTGIFRMADVRKASLDAHAAARDVEQDDPARSAARAAGQAIATAHVARHALAAAMYAATAVRDAADAVDAEHAKERERQWQLKRLRELASD